LAAAEEHRGLRLERRGLRGLSRDEGLRVLERLLASAATSIGVLPLDLRKWLEFYPAAASSRRLERLLSESPAARPAGDGGLLAALLAESLEARASRLEVFLADQLVRVLRVARAQLDRAGPPPRRARRVAATRARADRHRRHRLSLPGRRRFPRDLLGPPRSRPRRRHGDGRAVGDGGPVAGAGDAPLGRPPRRRRPLRP